MKFSKTILFNCFLALIKKSFAWIWLQSANWKSFWISSFLKPLITFIRTEYPVILTLHSLKVAQSPKVFSLWFQTQKNVRNPCPKVGPNWKYLPKLSHLYLQKVWKINDLDQLHNKKEIHSLHFCNQE
mgnify:CR=1 FL=1